MPNKVLVIRLSSLGDVVLTAPVFRSLKARWPDCRISALVKPAFAPALEGNPYIDEIIRFEGLGPALARIRKAGFTHLLDLHGNLRSRIIRRLAGVPHVSAYQKDALARRLFVAFGWRSPRLERHNVERYLDALRPWGIEPSAATVSLGEMGHAPRAVEGRKVLVIQSAFLGDSLLTLPLAREIKTALPGSRVTVLTLPKTAEIFESSPDVDEVLLDDKRGVHGGLRGPWRLAAELKARGFDLAIIPHRSFRSALIAWLSGIPRRVGFSSSAGRFFLTDEVPFTWLMHDLERNLALVKPLAAISLRKDESLYLKPTADEVEKISLRLAKDSITRFARVIGVHPGAAWATKRWLPERYAELCKRFKAEGFELVLVGGPADAALCAEIAKDSGALDWSGQTSLNELKALMGRLSLFVTNDSGPMHLATACGVPTLALFGPTTRELGFFPYGPRHRVLEADLPCRPCGLHGGRDCPEGHFLCMRLITTERAVSAAKEMLA